MTDSPTITISEGGFEMPAVDVLTGRSVVFGKSGSGKSNTVGVIAEELLDQGFPLCIVDADGEHYGLKEDYELLHVGGDESVDVQVTPDHASVLADVMLKNDVPVILDISGFIDEDEAHELVERVITHLFSMEKKQKKPFPVIVEEVHELVPEEPTPTTVAKSLIKVAKRGRKHGLGIVGASQRPAEVKKSFVTQASWSVWHKLTWSQDTNVVKDIIDRERAEAVQNLDTGQAIVMADWMDEVRTIQMRRKHTFDAGATPDLDDFETPDLKGVDENVMRRLQAITEQQEAEADEKDQLESEVEQLRQKKEELERELSQVESGDDDESEKVEALTAQAERLRNERDELASSLDSVTDERDRALEALEDRQERIDELEAKLSRFDEVRESIADAASILGVGVTSDESRDVAELRERVEMLEAENQRLEESLSEARAASESTVIPEDADYLDFIDNDAVRDAIEEAKEESHASPRYVSGVISSIIDEGGPVSYSDIASRLGLSGTSNVSKAVSTLRSMHVVEVDESGSEYRVDLNVEGLEDIIAAAEKRERTSELMERI